MKLPVLTGRKELEDANSAFSTKNFPVPIEKNKKSRYNKPM